MYKDYTDEELINLWEDINEQDEEENGVCTSITRELNSVEEELTKRGFNFDMEEGFPINYKLLKDINGIIYKGIYVWYDEDTNILMFTIYKENGEYNDSDDIGCMIYRNYDKEYVINYINNNFKEYIKEEV